jgi:asparagine synthase (glutamine-hydrolysing)
MCGIAGIIRFDGTVASATEVETMTGSLRHRGPDSRGLHIQGPFGLGMTRLAIIDVAGGQQPILNEDKTIALVCNGEIYNYPSLRSEMEQRGHHFSTHSDVEVILHLYEEYGEACFAKLNGMFGVAIADFRRQKLLLARDQFGQKPLYLWRQGAFLAFASELKALAGLPGFRRKPSCAAITAFLNFRYVPAPLTIYEDTEKLPPGSYLSAATDGECQVRRYWQIDLSDNRSADQIDSSKDIREQFTASVSRHLMSERPLGVFLSGGLDSAAIVACMHSSGHRDIHTYTVGFEGFEDNEFGNARRVAESFHTSHEEVTLTPGDFWDSLEPVIYAADEPLADLTTIPLYHLARYASRDVTVVLSGEGSDELLGGYQGVEEHRRTFDRLRAFRTFRPVTRQLSRLHWPDIVGRRLRAVSGSDGDYLARNPYYITSVFDTAFRRMHGLNGIKEDPVVPLSDYYGSRGDWHGVNLYLGALIEWWLPDDLLHKADRMTMAHSIELRCPFLDREFSRYCAGLPLNDKVGPTPGEGSRKIALKKAFKDVLPAGIAYQTKKGFTIPVYQWLKNIFAEKARQEILRTDGFAASLFPDNIRTDLLDRAVAGEKLSQSRVWSLIVLNKWAERWL